MITIIIDENGMITIIMDEYGWLLLLLMKIKSYHYY